MATVLMVPRRRRAQLRHNNKLVATVSLSVKEAEARIIMDLRRARCVLDNHRGKV